ncbi:ribosome silencing factor [Stappia sp. ES.058]|uniref:ribosome silencing factor n=1 Tax=Stappia sp. ES.058 TaxID=1881061 RepID=UPI00087BC651|nr:ribosome silencing factor [Stappia sp. ES.058]SDU47887.1 ribosome-associated protein [Stappia sp. ES.058]
MTFETEGTAATAPHHVAASTPPRAHLRETVLASLSDSKAEDIVSIDITGKSPMTDQVVVASGRSHRHVGAIADHLLRDLKEAGHGGARVEGIPQCDWVLIDAGDVIIHVFRPEVRAFYNIEKMWSVDDNTPVHYAG